jgi:hypothetical protein
MRSFLPLAALTVLLASGATEAQAFRAIGSGTLSCGSWSAHRREYRLGDPATLGAQVHSVEDGAWVLGFLSGIGFVGDNTDDPLDGVDADGVWAWIDNYCRDHPIQHIAKAAAAFYYAHPHR